MLNLHCCGYTMLSCLERNFSEVGAFPECLRHPQAALDTWRDWSKEYPQCMTAFIFTAKGSAPQDLLIHAHVRAEGVPVLNVARDPRNPRKKTAENPRSRTPRYSYLSRSWLLLTGRMVNWQK